MCFAFHHMRHRICLILPDQSVSFWCVSPNKPGTEGSTGLNSLPPGLCQWTLSDFWDEAFRMKADSHAHVQSYSWHRQDLGMPPTPSAFIPPASWATSLSEAAANESWGCSGLPESRPAFGAWPWVVQTPGNPKRSRIYADEEVRNRRETGRF